MFNGWHNLYTVRLYITLRWEINRKKNMVYLNKPKWKIYIIVIRFVIMSNVYIRRLPSNNYDRYDVEYNLCI